MFRTDAKCDIEAGEALSYDNYGRGETFRYNNLI
jgi:hypothetical protein